MKIKKQRAPTRMPFREKLGFKREFKGWRKRKDLSSLVLSREKIRLPLGSKFKPQLYIAHVLDVNGRTGVRFSDVKVRSDLDTTRVGNYEVVYRLVSRRGKKLERVLRVEVY